MYIDIYSLSHFFDNLSQSPISISLVSFQRNMVKEP